jgi:CelD/BcsL family acetyltransferase involved in cellulose biosynthesis
VRSRWEALFFHGLACSDARPTIFQSFAWNRLAAQIFRHQSPYVVHARSEHAELLVPAAIHEGWCLTLLGEALSDYLDFLACGDPGDLEELLAAAWPELARLRLPLGFQSVRPEAHFDFWERLAPEPFVQAPRARSSEISADHFAARHPKLHERYAKLQRKGAKLILLSPTREADLIRDIYFAKAEQFALSGNNLFADRRRIEFMVRACTLPETRCEMFALEWSGNLLAVLVTFREPEVRRIYGIWFDHRWARYSPGMLILYEVIRRSLAEGLEADLLTGEQPHKLRLATSAVQLYRVEAAAEELSILATRAQLAAA